MIYFAFLFAASATLHAKDGPTRGPRPPFPIIAALDTDKNHVLSAEEIAAAPTSLLSLDKDNNGALTKDELRPDFRKPKDQTDGSENAQAEPPADAPQEGRGKRPAPPILAALDADKDGELSAEEIANSVANLKLLDENSDGQLTPDEIGPGGPEGGRGPRGGRPPGPESEGEGSADAE